MTEQLLKNKNLKIRSLIEAILELNSKGQLSPQTVTELEKMKQMRFYKNVKISNHTDDKNQSFV
jgi:hypothetical protein